MRLSKALAHASNNEGAAQGRVVAVLRLVGVCVAVALALRAQTPLPFAVAYWPVTGAICLLIAGLLFGLVVWRRNEDEKADHPRSSSFTVSTVPFCVALVLWLGTAVLYATHGEGWAVYIGWPLSLAALLWASWTSPPRRVPFGTSDALPLAVIFPVALAMRMWHLTTLPPLIVGDTLINSEQAHAILNGTQAGLIGFGYANIPLPGFFPEALSISLFGYDLFGMCMSAVLSGMASLVATYLLAFELIGPRVGWLATGLLATSYTHLNFSRVPPHVHPLPFILFSLYYIVRAARTGRSWDAVIGGIFAGASFQMYFSGRVVVALAALIAAHQLVTRRFVLRQWALIALGFGVALGPMAVCMAGHWDQVMQRTWDVWSLGPGHSNTFFWQTLLDHSKVSFLTFWYYPNAWGERAMGPRMFDWFTGIFLALGFGHAVLHLSRPRYWLLVSSLVVTIVLSGVLTINPPFWQRMTAVLPLATILAALALDECARLVPLPRVVVATVLFAALSIVGYRNWAYFVRNESLRDAGYSAAARYACTMTDPRDIELVNTLWHPVIEYYLRILAPRHRVRWMSLDDACAGRWPPFRPTPLIMFLPTDRDRLLPALQATWPQGFVRELVLADGTLALDTYEPGSSP